MSEGKKARRDIGQKYKSDFGHGFGGCRSPSPDKPYASRAQRNASLSSSPRPRGYESYLLQLSVEVWAMKSSRTFSVLSLCGLLCLLAGFYECALGAVPPAQAKHSSPEASASPQSKDTDDSSPVEEVAIPGPLRSFLRMAAISQQITPEEVLPLLARNIIVSGYQGGKPTQYLILVNWYMDQARELQALAGAKGVIHVSNCDDAKPLLVILGYRLRQPCGPDAAVETADANRAFLTIDSGFPLAELEETLRGGKPFDDPYSSTKVPVMFSADEWLVNEKNANKGVVDSLLRNPAMARLYWGLARMDSETAAFLWKSLGSKKLVASAAVLDFYGSHISIRSG